MSRRFLIIANPIAGGGSGRRVAPQLQDALREADMEAELYFTTQSGDGGRRAAAIGPDEFDAVISVGGDGTLNEVLNGLEDPTMPLGLMAMGTANVLSMELSMPKDPARLAALLGAGSLQNANIGLIQGRRFLLFVSQGLDAAIVKRVDERRTGTMGKLRYIRPTLHVIRRWPIECMRLETEEGEVLEDLSTVVVTMVRNYAGVMRFPGEVLAGDGYLHVFAFRQRSRFQYARASLRALLGRLRDGKDVIHVKTRSLRISGAKGPWQIDGDLGGNGDIEVSLDPRQARLFVPPSGVDRV